MALCKGLDMSDNQDLSYHFHYFLGDGLQLVNLQYSFDLSKHLTLGASFS